MKSSNVDRWLGCLGLGAALLAAVWLIRWPAQGAMLTRGYQQGLVKPAVGLGQALSSADPVTAALAQRLERADVIRRFDPERLRATPPFALAGDGRFLPSVSDIHPRADMQLRWLGDENGELSVQPWGAQAWKVSLRSKGKVRPDWSAYSGLVAYYDLERIWIADIQGKRFQSVAQMPALDDGGVLRFSADGTALGVYLDQESRWVAQDLYVLVEETR